MRTGSSGVIWAGVAVAFLSACGSTAPSVAPSSAPVTSTSSGAPTTGASTPASVRVPDASSIAHLLVSVPVAQRPTFLDPYGTAIHGPRLGLGPTLRIAGYRADPLFVCVQHVDMAAGRAGAWSAYAVTPAGVRSWTGPGGQCPSAPGRPQVRE